MPPPLLFGIAPNGPQSSLCAPGTASQPFFQPPAAAFPTASNRFSNRQQPLFQPSVTGALVRAKRGMEKFGAGKFWYQFKNTTGNFGTTFPDCGTTRRAKFCRSHFRRRQMDPPVPPALHRHQPPNKRKKGQPGGGPPHPHGRPIRMERPDWPKRHTTRTGHWGTQDQNERSTPRDVEGRGTAWAPAGPRRGTRDHRRLALHRVERAHRAVVCGGAHGSARCVSYTHVPARASRCPSSWGAVLHSARAARARRRIVSQRSRDRPEHRPTTGGATSAGRQQQIRTAIGHFKGEIRFGLAHCLSFLD